MKITIGYCSSYTDEAFVRLKKQDLKLIFRWCDRITSTRVTPFASKAYLAFLCFFQRAASSFSMINLPRNMIHDFHASWSNLKKMSYHELITVSLRSFLFICN